MASKQKSFFDEKHSGTGSKQPWRPNRPHPPRDNFRRDNTVPLPKAPIPASSQSRFKRKTFMYENQKESTMVGIQSAAGDSDKENIGREGSQKSHRSRSNHKPHQDHTAKPPSAVCPDSQHLTTTPRPVSKKAIPPTPGVTVEDLLEEGQTRDPTPPKSTPKDQVGWEHPSLRSSQLRTVTPTAKRGTKRPRSPSPPSSSKDISKDKAQTSHKCLQTLGAKTPIRTPRYEPGTDLWSRYAKNDLTTPSRPPATARADMIRSSPHEPFTSGSRSWKRATSDLTHTARKKRKLNARQNAISSQGVSSSTPTATANPRTIHFIERLQELVDEPLDEDATRDPQFAKPSSSSPLPSGNVTDDAIPTASQRLAGLVMSDDSAEQVMLDARSACLPQDANANGRQNPSPTLRGEDSIEDMQVLAGLESDCMSENGLTEEEAEAKADLQQRCPVTDDVFSDLDIEEDELLSTCLAAERASTAGGERTPHSRPNNEGTAISACAPSKGLGVSLGRIVRASTDSRPISAGDEQATIAIPAAAPVEDEFALEDFDADELASIDLAMSKYPEPDRQRLQQAQKGTRQGDQDMINDYNDSDDETRAEIVVYGEQENPVDLIDDEFGDDGIEDVFAELVTEQETNGILPSNKQTDQHRTKTIQRYLVEAVHENQYQTEKGHQRQEKVVLVKEEKTSLLKVIILRETWFDSSCSPGTYVHVLAVFDRTGRCVINNSEGLIILHPDHLISATSVADSFGCMRRAVLQDRVKATSEQSEPLVYGSILHEVFQGALAANRWDAVWIDEAIARACAQHLEALFEINVGIEQATDRLRDKISGLNSWADRFVKPVPGSNAVVKDRNGSTALMSINKLLDVEEHIWSPMYGLKGNVDATVQVVMQDGEEQRTLTVPLELKTGKNTSSASHKAQTALYTLLMSDRYDIEVAYGILFYLETSELTLIPGMRHELMHMIKQRNELASYVKNRMELPPMLRSERLCGRCYAQPSCFTYHKLVEDGDGETSGLKDTFMDRTQHLLPQHRDFFRKWDNLLTKEEGDLIRFKRELWTMTSTERQKVGRAFAKVVIEPGSAGEIPGAQKINRFKYTFVKKENSSFFSFGESQITTGDPIVISDEKGHYALANGYVTSIKRTRITVAVDRRLHNARVRSNDFNSDTNQNFAGIMDVTKNYQSGHEQAKEPAEPVVYRIDKDEFSNGMATVRNNLIRLMEKDLFGSQPMRRLIIDRVAPITLNRSVQTTVNLSQDHLNVDQKAAIEKVMTARDYALVLGMPGTGKTTTIAHIIRTLTSLGKSVLLTSYTHTAVDNILLKIRKDDISILRIGTLAKVHPEVAEFAHVTADPKASFDEIRKSYNSQVVATTCLGINHSIFNQRIFDYCIVDEASQITLPVCLGPIRMARTFILVGDHYQLPPLVQNKEALEGGLDVSLFKYLSDAHPDSVVTLEHQYRMCEEIMSLSNELIYSGRLKCGSQAVATRRIDMPKFAELAVHHHTPDTILASQNSICLGLRPSQCWLHDALHPNSPVLFLNTDGLGDIAKEHAHGSRIVNQLEVTLTTQLVRALLTAGVPAAEVGVITLYRSQLALLRHELKARSSAASAAQAMASAAADVEMHTADKYQGRDKEAIILSLVRSNDANNVGDLLKDWRRVNVALTRARTKMVILGSWQTISAGNELLGRFCRLVEQRGWRYDLRSGAAEEHLFEDFLTQATAQQTVHEVLSPAKPAKIGLLAKSRKPRMFQATLDKENVVPKSRGNPNPPFKRPTMRVPEKRLAANPATVTGPVLRNVLDEFMG